MKCPFLRDARVKFCQASAYRKLLDAANKSETERCYSTAYVQCPAAAPLLAGQPTGSRCPLLHESEAEFCGAAALTKYIPATNALLSRCNSDDHLYCELYLAHADPAGQRRPGASVTGDASFLDGVPIPSHVDYAPNHMWADVADDGHCHIGIDAFLAKVLGRIDKISFVAPRGEGAPVAVLTVNGVDLRMEFPNALRSCSANVYLRTTPERVTADPYGAGWLFEGTDPTPPWDTPGDAVRTGLMPPPAAMAWMRVEADRLTAFVRDRLDRPASDGSRSLPDGGTVARGIAAQLEQQDLIDLFNDFFAIPRMRRSR